METQQPSVCRLRIAVAHLGEKHYASWWGTGFLDPVGFRYLELVYPKTAAAASVKAASEAACRVHDERIGRGRVAHLFRLTHEGEARWRGSLAQLKMAELREMCSKDAALKLLDTLAAGAKAAAGSGPTQIGALKEVATAPGLARWAATYAAGFRSGTMVFPYFA